MSKKKISLMLLLLLLTGFASMGVYVLRSRPPLHTVEARLGSISSTVSANGKVATAEQVDVGPKVGGLVTELVAKEGEMVRAGQVLARLDAQELRAKVHQAGMSVEEARSAIEVAQVQLNQANDQLARDRRLFESGVAPRAELDDLRHAADLRAAQLRSAVAARRETQASLEYVQTQLDNTVVRAPMSGQVILKHYERGKVVQAGDPLYTIADTGHLLVRAEVDETDAGKIRVGMPAIITSDAFPGLKINSAIQKIAWRVGRKRIQSDNPAEITDTKVLEAEMPIESDGQFRIGMAMDVKIATGKKDKALLIPRAAVQRRGPDLLVSVVKGEKVEELPVQLGAVEGPLVEVVAGLRPGDVVVIGKE